MASDKQHGESRAIPDQPCVHLRNKRMYVTGDIHSSGNGEGQHCWCNLTQHVLGPDDGMVGSETCTADRECFKGAP